MKKSIILLGAFALLIAAPSFAQVETEESVKTPPSLKSNTVQKEEVESKEATPSERIVIQRKEMKKAENKIESPYQAKEIEAIEPEVEK